MTTLRELLNTGRADWYDSAQCSGTDQDIFFPEHSHRGQPKAELENIAKSICKACPVIEECLDFALRSKQKDGIWGGKTRKERERIRRRERALVG